MRAIVLITIMSLFAANASAAEPPRRIMSALLFNLHDGIQAACGCEIIGVSVAQWASYPDTSGWRIDWKDETTTEQKAAGRAFLDAFDPSNPVNRVRP